jgi:hypothetical protein
MGEHNPNFDGCTGILPGAERCVPEAVPSILKIADAVEMLVIRVTLSAGFLYGAYSLVCGH